MFTHDYSCLSHQNLVETELGPNTPKQVWGKYRYEPRMVVFTTVVTLHLIGQSLYSGSWFVPTSFAYASTS